MTDEKLVKEFRSGNAKAFNILVERWQQRIYRFAYHYFSSHDDAMEITQRTFIKAYKKIDTLNNIHTFSAWIYRIANNLCLDEEKRVGRRRSTSLEAIVSQPIAHGNDVHPDLSVQQQELGDLLQRALNQLSATQRIVVIMKEYEGLKFREIAEILEEPESTIKSRMYYGLKTLRQLFDKWNIEMEELNYE